MAEMIVKLKWDEEDLGPAWMNPDNLATLLYTKTATKWTLLEFDVLKVDYGTRNKISFEQGELRDE